MSRNVCDQITVKHVSAKELDQDWSEDEFNSAIPLPLPLLNSSEVTDIIESEFMPNSGGDPEILIEPSKSSNELLDKITREVPFPDKYQFPYQCCGKLFTKYDGDNYVSSAAVIRPNLLLTAAHCVHAGSKKDFHSNIVFKPLFPMPYFSFKASKIVVLSSWHEPHQRKPYYLDYAFIKTDAPMLELGNLGIMINTGWRNSWVSLGYPADEPYDGKIMYMAEGDHCSFPGGKRIMCMNGNDMTGGSSGGPWLLKNKIGYAAGVNSHGIDSRPGVMFSPDFDNSIKYLLECAESL